MVTYDGEKPSTNKSTNTRTVGVAVGVTVRYREELDAVLPSVLDRAFTGELQGDFEL
jgi:hypothetical protein